MNHLGSALFPKYDRAWIGLTDPTRNESHTSIWPWVWDDYAPYEYSNWAVGGRCLSEPNDCNLKEWCANIWTTLNETSFLGLWNDDRCDGPNVTALCSKRAIFTETPCSPGWTYCNGTAYCYKARKRRSLCIQRFVLVHS